MEMWKCGNVEMWKCGNVEMWKCRNVEMWMWKCGNVIYVVRKYGSFDKIKDDSYFGVRDQDEEEFDQDP